MKGVLLCVGVFLGIGSAAALAREWTDDTGKSSVEASLSEVLHRPDMKAKEVLRTAEESIHVRLLKNDGSVVTVPFARLSKQDQDYVRRQIILFWKSNPSWNPRLLEDSGVLGGTWRSKDRQAFPYDLRLTFQGVTTGTYELRQGERVAGGGSFRLERRQDAGAVVTLYVEHKHSRSSHAIARKSTENLLGKRGLKFGHRSLVVVKGTARLLANGTLQLDYARAENPWGLVTLDRVTPPAAPKAPAGKKPPVPAAGLPIHDFR